MSELDRRAMRIFEDALDLAPDAQAGFIADACGGDAALREEVELLLASDRQAHQLSEAVRAEIADVAGAVMVAPSGQSLAMVGVKLNGRYVIEKRIGAGGVGVVFLARDEHLHQRQVVVKVLKESRDPWLLRKFTQESEALTRLDHPNVVKVLDRGMVEDGRPFLVMEFVKGETLEDFLKLGAGRLDIATVILLIHQIFRAVETVHGGGIIHRDLKTSNIMVRFQADGTLQAKLIDFGIAKIFETTAGNQTTTPLTVGTLPYMAAELFDGQEASVASDVYALGIIAFELLTGARPFVAKGRSLLAQILEYRNLQETGAGGQLRSLRPELPEQLESVLLTALAFHPEARYQRVLSFETALIAALEGIDAAGIPETETLTLGGSESKVEAASAVVPSGTTARRATGDLPKTAPVKMNWPVTGLIGILIGTGIALTIVGVPPRWGFPKPGSVPTPAPAPVSVPVSAKNAPALPFTLEDAPTVATAGQEIRLRATLNRGGYFYVFSESPSLRTDALPNYTVLFPGSSDNGGSSRFDVRNLVIPPVESGPGFVFEGKQGTEKLWVVWSAESVPVLETVRIRANPKDQGVVTEREQVLALGEFLKKHVEPDENVTVRCVKIEHR